MLTKLLAMSQRRLLSARPTKKIEFLDCGACLYPCENASHPQLPLLMQKKIDNSALWNSVKPYKQHLIIPEGNAKSWPHSIEEQAGSLAEMAANNLKLLDKKNRVVLTASDGPEFFWFPKGVQLTSVTAEEITKIANSIVNGEDLEIGNPIEGSVIFVCSHTKRDKRCGVAGPILIEEFEKEISRRNIPVRVRGVSHIGGHKFAGNIICYTNQGEWIGDWYGRVRSCDVASILDAIQQGKVVKDLWRGRFGGAPVDSALSW